MDSKEIEKILERIQRLEDAVFGINQVDGQFAGQVKQKTLAELVRGKKFENGQQRIAIVVGYLEKIQRKSNIKGGEIKQAWIDGKIEGSYDNSFLRRAIKEGLIRDMKDGIYDLSQSGESFFEQKLKE